MAKVGENNENEERAGKEKTSKTDKRIFFAMVAALLIIFFLICGYIAHIINAPKKESGAPQKPTIGIIRIKDAIKSHKSYADIEKLKSDYESVMTEIMALSAPTEIKVPEVDGELFKDSARQKLSQTIVDKIAALEEKRRATVEKYAKDTEPAYEKKRAEIDARYLTVIADLRMKLDNSDILRLSDAKINELSEQLTKLQHERGDAQEALKAEREQDIYNYGEKVIKEMAGEIATVDKEAQKLMSEAALKESEVTERNMRLLEEAAGTGRIVKIREKEAVLEKLREEIAEKEEQVLTDIASIAAKYAMQNELDIVVSDTGVNIKSLLPAEFQPAENEKYSRVITLNTLDITDDIIQDLLIDER